MLWGKYGRCCVALAGLARPGWAHGITPQMRCALTALYHSRPQGHYQRVASQQQQQAQQQGPAAPAMPHVHVHARGGCHEHTAAILQALADKDRRAAAAQRQAAEAAERAALLAAEDGASGADGGSPSAAAGSSRSPVGGCRGGSCKGANGLCSGVCSMEGEELCVPLLVKERREQSLAAACVSVAEDASHVSAVAARWRCWFAAPAAWLLIGAGCAATALGFVRVRASSALPAPAVIAMLRTLHQLPLGMLGHQHCPPSLRALTLFVLLVSSCQVIGLYMTEAGIIFHSLMIGVTLGVTGGDAFSTLLIALALHQVCREA